jgi:acetyl-CoA carboxylase carboxyl transferase subunit alpha
MSKSSDRLLLEFEQPVAALEQRIQEIRALAEENDIDASEQIRQLEAKAEELRREIFRQLTPVERLQVARHPRRPTTLDYVQTICDDWFELHGDRQRPGRSGHCRRPSQAGGSAGDDPRPPKGRDTKTTSTATSACPTLLATAKPCGSWSMPTALVCPF